MNDAVLLKDNTGANCDYQSSNMTLPSKLVLVWKNPNKKQSRKKMWANLRIVRDDQRRTA